MIAPVAAAAPADASLQARLGAILGEEAASLAEEGRPGEAIPIFRRAIASLRPAVAVSRYEDPARGWLTENLWNLARLLRAAGSGEEADRLDAERRDLWKDHPGELATLALQETRRAALIGYGKTPIGGPAQSVRATISTRPPNTSGWRSRSASATLPGFATIPTPGSSSAEPTSGASSPTSNSPTSPSMFRREQSRPDLDQISRIPPGGAIRGGLARPLPSRPRSARGH